MTGKDWIESVSEQLIDSKKRLERHNERLMTLRAEVISVTAIRYDSDRVQASASDDKLAQKYALMDEISRKMLKEMENYNIIRATNIKRLEGYVKNPTLSYCLERRHLDFKSVAQIAKEDNVSEICVKKRFNKAYSLLNSIYILEKYRKSC